MRPHGVELLHDGHFNKGTAFTEHERDAFRLRGLLPPRVMTQDQQVEKVLENLRNKPSDLERYVYLTSLQDRNERLFYRVITDHLVETMPIIYTPTVGIACQQFGHLWRRPRGMFITARDRGRVQQVLSNWPDLPVRTIVVTDGERILGLGDLGANGMGIPIGKLALYTACAGIDPALGMPVTIDVGTSNEALLRDPFYPGLLQPRIPQDEYDALFDEFMHEVTTLFPNALVQFEDFGTSNAFRLLERYRDHACCFNDDIQGTAAVCLAGLYSATQIASVPALTGQKILFLGAGEAGVGIADLVVSALVAEGVPHDGARHSCWFVDSQGLVVRSRPHLASHKRRYAHDHEPVADLLGAVQQIRPSALVGVSGQGQAFTQAVIEAMSAINERPIVFALSNPTPNAECTAEQAYRWSEGRAIFASGSPFPPVHRNGGSFHPGQANNAYIFPGVALGVLASGARHVTEAMFFAAARTLANRTSEADRQRGSIFPPLYRSREISVAIAAAVARVAYDHDFASAACPADLRGFIEAQLYDAHYPAPLEEAFTQSETFRGRT